jgi:ABC-2 type transport system ATP-binding protein
MTHPFPTRLTNSGSPPLTTPLAIETRGLQKRYGKLVALNNLSLQVPEGAVYLLVGPNGAGKSTAMKTLMGLIRRDSGDAMVFGLDVERNGPTVRANVGYIPDDATWGYGWMSLQTLFDYHARYYARWDHDYIRRLAKLFRFRLDAKLSSLSKGERRRVHIAMALAHRPPLLLLDEPTDGLDPVMRDETLAMLVDHLAETPTTVLLSTHHVEEVERLAEYIGVIANGELCAQLSFDLLQRELRQYRFQTPNGMPPVPTLQDRVVRRNEAARERIWTIWGDEREVIAALTAAGAVVHDASTLSLLDATLCLLNPGPQS